VSTAQVAPQQMPQSASRTSGEPGVRLVLIGDVERLAQVNSDDRWIIFFVCSALSIERD
jgi:hypothetical protein